MPSFETDKSAPPADMILGDASQLPNKTDLIDYSRPPSYMPFDQFNSPPPAFDSKKLNDFDDLVLPSVPDTDSDYVNKTDDLDIDEITKRFQNLKNNK